MSKKQSTVRSFQSTVNSLGNNKSQISEQESFETQAFSKADTDAYEMLFEALNDSPEIGVPVGFASTVSKKVLRRERLLTDIKVYAFYAAVFLFFIIVIIGALAYAKNDLAASLLSNLPYVFAISAVYLIIQTLDRVLLKKNQLG